MVAAPELAKRVRSPESACALCTTCRPARSLLLLLLLLLVPLVLPRDRFLLPSLLAGALMRSW